MRRGTVPPRVSPLHVDTTPNSLDVVTEQSLRSELHRASLTSSDRESAFHTSKSSVESDARPSKSGRRSSLARRSMTRRSSVLSKGRSLAVSFAQKISGSRPVRPQLRESIMEDGFFDSPLQEALAVLRGLGAHMEASRLQREADAVTRVMRLLHSPELHSASALKQRLAEGDMQVDPQLLDWLTQMEWLPPQQAEEQSEERVETLEA